MFSCTSPGGTFLIDCGACSIAELKRQRLKLTKVDTECNFYETKSNVHLDHQTLMERLHLFTCKQILLTHLGEEMLLNLDKIKLPCAEDNMQIRI